MTVLFADVADFTAISERLDPEEVHQIMEGCFKTLMDGIHRYEGAINQFTGDGVMALFGAPVDTWNLKPRDESRPALDATAPTSPASPRL